MTANLRPKALRPGDRVAIVSLSSGMVGEEFCAHSVALGERRLRQFGLEPVWMPNSRRGISFLSAHPEARAADLKAAFADREIRGIVCAIGGDDTYRLLPFLLEDRDFCETVRADPKIFTGFSDTTINHLMFYKLGLVSFYGPCFLCDLAELHDEMLPYTRAAFLRFFLPGRPAPIRASEFWYEERTDFSAAALGTPRVAHRENRGYELILGEGPFSGRLLGGCIDSLYDLLSGSRYADEPEICRRYGLFPVREEWAGKVLFLETSEEQPSPEQLFRMLSALRKEGVFDAVRGILVGKPQNERYYEEYKHVYREAIGNAALPVLMNLNFGHALPRTVLPYGAAVEVDPTGGQIRFLEDVLL